MIHPITGLIAATLTPFGEDGRVDPQAIRQHVEFLVLGGLRAVAPVGTTGEFLYLTEEERAAVVRATTQASGGRLRVIAGIWGRDPAAVGRLARAAEKAGASATFLTTPIYYPMDDEAILRWYRHARGHTGLPLFAYHIPQYAVNGVSLEVLTRLLEEGTIQGIKDSTGKPERLRQLLSLCQERAPVYAASDSFVAESRRLGADGFISALANIYPRTTHQAWEGDEAAQQRLNAVRAAVKGYGGISALKVLLRARGLPFLSCRIPFTDLDEAQTRELLEAVEAIPALE